MKWVTCKRCGNNWESRVDIPKRCPKCVSPYWNIAKRRNAKKEVGIAFTTGLNYAHIERLALLAEECGEVIQVVGKIMRHGYESKNPLDEQAKTNRALLSKELGDLAIAVQLLLAAGDFDRAEADIASKEKLGKIGRWLHFNKIGVE